MKNINNKIFGILSSLLILFGALVPTVGAEEITVSGNGAYSDNVVTATQTDTTNVTQSNTAVITNNVTADTNTGGNTADNNSGGDVNISTGDATSSTDVSNLGNVSVASVGDSCDCQITNSTIVSGNLAGSVNTVNNTGAYNTNISVNQIANVTNNLVTNANTGINTANNNNGNVSIVTGNIYASTSLLNALNYSKVKVANGKNADKLLKIAGNGVSSVNAINNVEINNVNIVTNNIANFLNNIIQNLNTGGNTANNNNGDVSIKTGDVWSEIKVKNLANISEVIIDCGCKEKRGEEKPPILPPSIVTTPPSSASGGVGGPGGAGGGSSAVAAAIENMLPATGTNWLILALLGNIMMLFLGAYLRLRSGRSPGLALAI